MYAGAEQVRGLPTARETVWVVGVTVTRSLKLLEPNTGWCGLNPFRPSNQISSTEEST
jgi:hypothetical protein